MGLKSTANWNHLLGLQFNIFWVTDVAMGGFNCSLSRTHARWVIHLFHGPSEISHHHEKEESPWDTIGPRKIPNQREDSSGKNLEVFQKKSLKEKGISSESHGTKRKYRSVDRVPFLSLFASCQVQSLSFLKANYRKQTESRHCFLKIPKRSSPEWCRSYWEEGVTSFPISGD